MYYKGSVPEYTNLFIFCDTCLQWDFPFNIFKYTCFRVNILRHLVLKYILWHFLYYAFQVPFKGCQCSVAIEGQLSGNVWTTVSLIENRSHKWTHSNSIYSRKCVDRIATQSMSKISILWRLIVVDREYTESSGRFLSGGNADASHAVYIVPDDCWYSGLALSFGIRSKSLTIEE